MTKRSVPEWQGKTADSLPPARVRLRVFERHKGTCHLSGRKIRPGDDWDLDHVQALSMGGMNVESNLAPALREKHREKTVSDRKQLAKDERIRKKHLGLYKSKSPMRGSRKSKLKKKLDGSVEKRERK